MVIAISDLAPTAAVNAGFVVQSEDELGFCGTADGPNMMPALLFIQNREFRQVNQSAWSVQLNRESVRFFTEDPNTGLGQRVDWLLTGDGEIDIDLQFAILENKVVVYWRETFKHRIYKQGVVAIDGEELIPICQGSAGSEWLSPY